MSSQCAQAVNRRHSFSPLLYTAALGHYMQLASLNKQAFS